MDVVKITEQHIAKGLKRSRHLCPIALACQEHFVTKAVQVSNLDVIVDLNYYKLPGKARMFINNFDDGQIVYPFELHLDSPFVRSDG